MQDENCTSYYFSGRFDLVAQHQSIQHQVKIIQMNYYSNNILLLIPYFYLPPCKFPCNFGWILWLSVRTKVMVSICDRIEFGCTSISAICPLPLPVDFAYLGYPLPYYQQLPAMWHFLPNRQQEQIFFFPLACFNTIIASLIAPLVVTDEPAGFKERDYFLIKLKLGFFLLYFFVQHT